ncbi:hypothetical protein DSECCO2_328210 [anaerobic digester metagenome]|uniref:Fic family protein n=1 Tax=Oscillibacter ruminantium TaxID=1263547 RepID=UPI00331DB0BD
MIYTCKDRFHLTLEENLFLARKLWDASVFCGMKMENRNITFPETKAILNGINVPRVSIDDAYAVCRYRDAWKFVMETLSEPMTLDYMIHVNEIVARGEALQVGALRNGSVTIGDLTPEVPTTAEVQKAIDNLQNGGSSDTQRALDTFAVLVRMQPFWDGNKRTAMLLANKDLITHGRGLFVVTDQNGLAFNDTLSQFINDGNPLPLQKQLYEQCLGGLNEPINREYIPIPLTADVMNQLEPEDELELS